MTEKLTPEEIMHAGETARVVVTALAPRQGGRDLSTLEKLVYETALTVILREISRADDHLYRDKQFDDAE